MDIMNALKKTVESVRDWTNEKLENKVEKVANKGLSTNDYTTVDKNKVNNTASPRIRFLVLEELVLSLHF